MYRILSDGHTVYDPRLPENAIISGKLTLEVNKAGSLTVTIPKSNPHYGMIALMKSIVTVYDDDRLIFRGRPYAPSRNLYRDNEIACEGELAFFNDTYQEPFEFYGTVTDLFTQVITAHNSQVSAEKQFKVGTINVTNDTESGKITRSDIEYMTTWDFLREKFFESELGGYLWVRHEDDGAYIDYLSDLNFIGKQGVTQCINLTDVTEEVTTDDLATVVVPLGAKIKDEDGNDTDEYLTVSGVNDGKIYIEDAEGISEYGRIVKIVKHDDITDASNLLRAGQADIGAAMGVATTVTITAADLARAGYDADPFCFGTYVDVNIANLGINDRMLIKKLSIDLLAPESNTITVGQTVRSFTASSVHTSQTIGKMESNVSAGLRGNKQEIAEVIREVSTQINQTEENIISTVTEEYYSKSDTDDLLASLSTEFEQTSSGFEMRFEEFQQSLDNLDSDTFAEFNEWKKYIQFENGNIILGEAGNELILRIENNKITFLENGAEIAYWQNRKFYAVDGEFINSLRLGKFAFLPRPNGNLSFKKVMD